MNLSGRSALFLSCAAAAACVDPVDDTGSATAELNNCKLFGCGENVARVGMYKFHELDLNGGASNGVRIGEFLDANDKPMTLDVIGSKLIGIRDDASIVSGAALEGSTLHLDHDDGDSFRLHFVDVGTTPYWVGGGKATTYHFTVEDDNGTNRDLCAGVGIDNYLWAGIQKVAVVHRGDRYDPAGLTVTAIGADTKGWFNISCAGTAPAKLELTRMTTSGSNQTHASSRPQRTTWLKLITADYCGVGYSFTQDGEPLLLDNKPGWMSADDTLGQAQYDDALVDTYEALWTSTGAKCLSTPRRLDDEPGLWADIAAVCGAAGKPVPPPCGAPPVGWQLQAYGLSANPF
jgi:hypothetical protein